jgi:hypothetical protein
MKLQESRSRRSIASRPKEGLKGWFKVNMQPLYLSLASDRLRAPQELNAKAPSPGLRMHGRIQEERMAAAVPSNIHESHQLVGLPGA